MQVEAAFRFGLTERPRLLAASESVESLLGFASHDFLSGNISLQDKIHRDDTAVAATLFSPSFVELAGTVRLRIRGADGKICCIKGQSSKTSGCAEEGTVLTLVLNDVRDVQDPGNKSLIDSYNALLANASDYIYIKNRNHVLLAASHAVAKLTDRIDDSAALSGTDYDLHCEQEADRYYRLEEQLLTSGQCVTEIQPLASRLKFALREGDTLARLGGDEFVAVLVDLPKSDDALPVLARLLESAEKPLRIGNYSLRVSVSIGVAYHPAAEKIDADRLLRQADQAMYQAKLDSKNCYHIFSPVLLHIAKKSNRHQPGNRRLVRTYPDSRENNECLGRVSQMQSKTEEQTSFQKHGIG
ncbi:MAG TPA: sensor domain-containing diguanylate cyclase [Terracidiphilus sp.]|nr:sensor domain-containing diguanylate cyclase [Terracidiphilus sp.]